MEQNLIDYEALKKRGFLKSRAAGEFALRTRMPAGNYNSTHLKIVSNIADTYGEGFVHMTVRQGIEIPHIKYADIDNVEFIVKQAGIQLGTSGSRLRATTSCPGNNWCKSGLINTFAFVDALENEHGIICAMDLPHKFKIAVAGCPNLCTRGQSSEIGVFGQVDLKAQDASKRIGYGVYIGGCGGKNPRQGIKLEKVFSQEDLFKVIEKVIEFYRKNAQPKQRLGETIEQFGKHKFLEVIGLELTGY
ncbi:MAG: hypothetical protein KJ915_06090 [Candidatus Omnitrophica bacterium]|nr:hypothetical protein [Candidatus Omnitrophota bacterium]